MPRRRPVELNISHERWLVSYSDFITLLFAFFVVMYSISQVNESKYRVLSDTLVDAFRVSTPKSLQPIQVGEPNLSVQVKAIELGQPKNGETLGDGAFERTADLPQLQQEVEQELDDLIDDELVRVKSNEFWLEVELKSGILFSSADAVPSLQAHGVFEDIARLLKGFDNPIQVEGFTDNVPISNNTFASNWDLSTARASSVVKLLIKYGIEPSRLSAVGYGEYQPVADNSTAQGRAENRRVVLMIAREKIKRPGVSSTEDIERALDSSSVEQSQPYPQVSSQPQGEHVSASAEARVLAEQLEQLLDIDAATRGAQGRDDSARFRDSQAVQGSVKPIQLKGGGLLFTNDPQQIDDNESNNSDRQE